MPRIFDNIDQKLLPALGETLEGAAHADFCVGYFNLRGWKGLASYVDGWSGQEGECCRLLVGMQPLPQDELRQALSLAKSGHALDNQTAIRLKKRVAHEFREQLTFGAPTNADEAGLRQLSRQLKSQKLKVKVFLKHPLHAKLYLAFRPDPVSPIVGFLGSSNLTFAGLQKQGELNIDVLDHDATNKLAGWFEDRWNDRWCMDISKELAAIIDESWAREDAIPPLRQRPQTVSTLILTFSGLDNGERFTSRWLTTLPKRPVLACPSSSCQATSATRVSAFTSPPCP